ncbi:MAG TPA: tetratricopeptide repeat protein [Pyrinomonadaceae bacterium]|jgi:tetratricopeptide (TPR) repeat protein
MRSRFTHLLCSLVALCCVAPAGARAQEATSQPAAQAATQKSAKKRPARKTAAKKTAPDKAAAKATADSPADPKAAQADGAKGQAAKPAAAKKASTAAAAKQTAGKRPARAKGAGATDAAKGEAEKPAGEKSAAEKTAAEKTAGERSATKGETEKSAPPSAGDAKPRARARRPKAESRSAEGAAGESTSSSAAAKPPRSKTAGGKSAEGKTPEDKPAEGKSAEGVPAADKSSDGKTAENKAAKAKAAESRKAAAKKSDETPKEAELRAKLEEILKLSPWERIAELDDFLDLDLPDALAARAEEYLVSAQAAYGDDRLRAGDAARGVALFKDAVATASAEMSDKLYFEVVSQLPTNLALRGQPEAAFDLARRIERKAGGDARRLLALAAFYLAAERGDEATRLASAAVKLSPDMAAAHQALAAAHRLSLRLDESATEYARAAELDPKSAAARRSLADLRRATGKPEEALKLYREQLAAEPKDAAARAGIVLSLFDAGRRGEAERELDAALKDDARNLPLLAGAAYWYAAHGDEKRAVELSAQAIKIEPRHPWAQIALARALSASGMWVEAERSVRFAQLYSRFPTLDYELASALSSAGLYAEAADELNRSFTLKGDEIETRLAGRAAARADNFIELLAPERRASLFEPQAADTPENARSLKGLLAMHLALKSAETEGQRADAEPAATRAAREFAEGGDAATRTFRQLYAAGRLLRRGVGARAALELAEGAKTGLEAALAAPQATVATTADELREARARTIAEGGTPNVPDLPRDVLDKLVRGRIDEMIGWAQLSDGRAAEAVVTLRRAVGVLPENSLYWRNALWRLGSALAANKEPAAALDTYVRSYDPATSDATRRAVIEGLYRKLNGSLAGLDVLIGAARPARPAPTAPQATAQGEAAKDEAAKGEPVKTDHAPSGDEVRREERKDDTAKVPEAKSDAAKSGETKSGEAKPDELKGGETRTDAAKRDETKGDAAKGEAAKKEAEKSEVKKSEATRGAEAAAQPTPAADPAPTPEPAASPGQTPAAPVAESQAGGRKRDAAAPAAEKPTKTAGARPRRGGECALALSSEEVSLAVGGQGSFVATLEGEADAAKIAATTADWSDILVLREPAKADGAAKFTVTSISKTAGAFTVTLKSPCGSKRVTVNVK